MFSLVFDRKHQSRKVNLCTCSYCLYKHMLHEQACWLAEAHQKALSRIKLFLNNVTFLTWTSTICNLTSLNNMSQLYSFHVIKLTREVFHLFENFLTEGAHFLNCWFQILFYYKQPLNVAAIFAPRILKRRTYADRQALLIQNGLEMLWLGLEKIGV